MGWFLRPAEPLAQRLPDRLESFELRRTQEQLVQGEPFKNHLSQPILPHKR
ncbi:hypothetical protein IWX85_000379 [Polaromonas sp. CG_9.11]|nr:hypothetical protein [Polaromonas sp. CG_9.11]